MTTGLRCNQFEKYKLALKTWEKRKGQCSPVPVIPQLASNEVDTNTISIHRRFVFDFKNFLFGETH